MRRALGSNNDVLAEKLLFRAKLEGALLIPGQYPTKPPGPPSPRYGASKTRRVNLRRVTHLRRVNLKRVSLKRVTSEAGQSEAGQSEAGHPSEAGQSEAGQSEAGHF